MKYKTLFRVLLKAMGVFFFVQGVVQLIERSSFWLQVTQPMFRSSLPPNWVWYDIAQYIAGYGLQIAIGLYLFFGGKWIVDKAIPGNRPYCHECGYDLTQNTSGVCSECGTPTPMQSRPPGGSDASQAGGRPQA